MERPSDGVLVTGEDDVGGLEDGVQWQGAKEGEDLGGGRGVWIDGGCEEEFAPLSCRAWVCGRKGGAGGGAAGFEDGGVEGKVG